MEPAADGRITEGRVQCESCTVELPNVQFDLVDPLIEGPPVNRLHERSAHALPPAGRADGEGIDPDIPPRGQHRHLAGRVTQDGDHDAGKPSAFIGHQHRRRGIANPLSYRGLPPGRVARGHEHGGKCGRMIPVSLREDLAYLLDVPIAGGSDGHRHDRPPLRPVAGRLTAAQDDLATRGLLGTGHLEVRWQGAPARWARCQRRGQIPCPDPTGWR